MEKFQQAMTTVFRHVVQMTNLNSLTAVGMLCKSILAIETVPRHDHSLYVVNQQRK